MTSPSDRPCFQEPDREHPAGRSRRVFIKRAVFGSLGLAGVLVSGCGRSENEPIRPDGDVQTPTGNDPRPGLSEPVVDCQSTETLSPQDLKVRQALDYTPESPEPGETCANCRFYQPPNGKSSTDTTASSTASGSCGGCQLFPGPVVASGWCTSWAEKQS